MHLLLWRADIPADRIRWLWRQMLPVTLLVLLLWPLFYPAGEPVLWSFWRVRITLPSLLQGLVAALRVDALAFAVFVLLVSTGQAQLVQGLTRLGVPFEWGLTLSIALRYLPLLYGVYGTITDAQRARGWTVERGSVIVRVRAYVPTLVALIIAALRLSDTLTLALAARGFRPGYPRSSYRSLQLGGTDRACLAGMGLILVGVLGVGLSLK
jgi:energy-coupling factor transport system permease protein